MRKLSNMLLIQETIGGGFLNENGKAVVTTKTKTYARSKDWYEKNKSDETLKVLGDAYEVIRAIQGRKVRQVVTIEKAEELESVIKPNILIEKADSEKSIEPEEDIEPESEEEKSIEPKKRGPKKKEEKEI